MRPAIRGYVGHLGNACEQGIIPLTSFGPIAIAVNLAEGTYFVRGKWLRQLQLYVEEQDLVADKDCLNHSKWVCRQRGHVRCVEGNSGFSRATGHRKESQEVPQYLSGVRPARENIGVLNAVEQTISHSNRPHSTDHNNV